MDLVVNLNELETKIAVSVGGRRYKNARSKGIHNAKMGDQSNKETDIESAGAELAFCKAFNLYPDLQFEVLPPHDATFHNGMTVDVKQTKYENGRLLATLKKCSNPSDIYVLLTGNLPTFHIRGGIPQELFFQESNIGNLGHGDGYMVEQKVLWPIDDLLWRYEYGDNDEI